MSMEDAHPNDDLCDEPLQIGVVGAAVVLTGPDGVALAMTAQAAARSADLLSEAAAQAKANTPQP